MSKPTAVGRLLGLGRALGLPRRSRRKEIRWAAFMPYTEISASRGADEGGRGGRARADGHRQVCGKPAKAPR